MLDFKHFFLVALNYLSLLSILLVFFKNSYYNNKVSKNTFSVTIIMHYTMLIEKNIKKMKLGGN